MVSPETHNKFKPQNKSQQHLLFESIVKKVKTEKTIQENQSALVKILKDIYSKESVVDYPAIFEVVSNSEIVQDDIDGILYILKYAQNGISDIGLKDKIERISRHFKLSYNQKCYFIKLEKSMKQELEKSRDEYENSRGEIQKEIEKTKSELNKIYAQFITIFGIFTAIVLSAFGGLNLIVDSFKHIDKAPAWKLMLLSSTLGIATLTMLFLLTSWVSKTVKIAFEIKSKQGLLNILNDNGAFATGLFILCYLMIASVVLSSNTVRKDLKELFTYWDSWPIIITLFIPIFIGIGIFLKTVDLRNFKK